MSKSAVSDTARARAELELRRRRRHRADVTHRAIPDDMTFRAWCEDLAARGLKVDGKPFSLDNRQALAPIYDAIPSTREEAAGKMLVIQKATQLGLTVWEVLANLYLAIKFEPLTIGMFLPDQATATYKSEHRFMRVVRTLPIDLYRRFTRQTDVETGEEKRRGEGNVLTRVMGESIFLFLWTSGKLSTESRPMDVTTLDEVQEMTLDQIDKVLARLGDSEFRFVLLLSTANMPDLDINFWYLLGTQEVWHTECAACGVLSDLSDPASNFPACIAYNTGYIANAPLNAHVYVCPECGAYIGDPQNGRYIPRNPDGPFRSFLLPRTISPRLTPGELITHWNRAVTGDQKKSFYNRTLARPYIDQDQLPVTLAHCRLCVEEGLRAGIAWQSSGSGTVMGIDQMGGFHAVIIKKRLPDNRQACVHVEAVFQNPSVEDPDNSPWRRSAELMEVYGVDVCVVEQLPNVDAARSFINKFPGRAFLASYADLKNDFMAWGDAASRTDRKTAADERTRYTVTLNQYKCMQTSLFRVRNQHCLFPDPAALEQDVIEKGERKRIPILQEWVFMHFTRTALVVEADEETRKSRPKVMKVGLDPHFSFANMLCDVAWARVHGAGMFILPGAGSTPNPARTSEVLEVLDKTHFPGTVRQMLGAINLPKGEVCGRCAHFKPDEAWCGWRGMKVRPEQPGCGFFVAEHELI